MNFKVNFVPLCLVFVLCFGSMIVQASNILFFHLVASSSHRNSIWPLAEKLADKGHNITYIISLPAEKRMGSHPKIEEISSQKAVQVNREQFDDLDINIKLNNTVDKLMQQIFQFSLDLCEAFHDSPEIQNWLNRPGLHYDLVMIDASLGECIYPLVYKFQAKYIFFAPAVAPCIYDALGLVPESSSIPTLAPMFGSNLKPDKMNLFARIQSTLDYLLWRLGHVYYLSELEKLLRNRLTFDFPNLLEMEANPSLVLVNAHFIEEYPLSLPPFVQQYSGLSCNGKAVKERKSLPSNLAKFVEANDTDGFIYISFGTVIDISLMPDELRNTFYEVFKAFPKLRFLWRWTGEVIPKNKPNNLLFQRWFPQQDVLAHEKIKAFVTQAGRPSTQEAICYGVPMITMPVWADQDYNANRLEYIGAAINLDMAKLDANTLKQAIKEIAYSDKYEKRMTELSKMYKDRPVDPLDNALFWTEYVLRHNTSVMKSLGMNQTWYQRRLLDVYLTLAILLVAVGVVVLSLLYYLLKFIVGFIWKGNSNGNKVKRE